MARVEAEAGGEGWRGKKGKSRLSWLKPFFVAAILALAGFLLYRTLGRYDYDELVDSIASIPVHRLLLAGGFAAASYLTLTAFDWLALRYVEKPLPYRTAALTSFVSLSLGHNIGFAALSSGAVRYRFYSRAGLDAEEVGKVILFCGVTVGLGLMIVGGFGLLLDPALAEEVTGLGRGAVFAAAGLCLFLPLAYLGLAACLRRPLRFRRWSMAMPSLRLALCQLVVGPLNFALVAACLHQAILGTGEEISYFAAASVYVLANVATLISHVPGGLGVIEMVVGFLLPGKAVIGAVLAFRLVYFLIPLALGASAFALVELKGRLAAGGAAKKEALQK